MPASRTARNAAEPLSENAAAARVPTLLVIEQLLNGLQFGLMLFLLAAGLTLVFGVMDMINLAHGSLYMVGAFVAAWLVAKTGSFVWGVLGAIGLTAVFGMLLEITLLRTLYARDHLSQVLATFALILILNDGVKMVFGTDLPLSAPDALAGPVQLLPGLSYPAYRLLILAVGLVIAVLMYTLVAKTRLGALVRAGASNRVMTEAMGIDVKRLFTVVFGIGAGLCAVAGALLGPLLAVQVGMGENILILAFVVIVIGGIGSIRGALIGSILVGCVDTLGRTLLQQLLREFLPPQWASAAGPAIASIAVYVFMAVVLAVKPQGLFPARA
jgi:branched-chain amino acid transport system permease protein